MQQVLGSPIKTFTIEYVAADEPDAQWCVGQYYALLNERFEQGYDPNQAQPTRPEDFAPPNGAFLLARMEDKPVGCILIRKLEDGVAEIKRLWVAPQTRGMGLGQKLLEAAEEFAREQSLMCVRLDTNKSLTEAIALYKKNGYHEVPAFNDDPYPDFWFEKHL